VGKVSDAVLGGWQTTGIFTLQSGTPFSALMSTDVPNTVDGGVLRPEATSKNGNLPRGQRNVNRWFDTSAFTLPAAFTYGNAGRNTLIGPGLGNLDWGFYKNFRLKEQLHLQFRSEFFNLTNTAHFGLPNQYVNLPGAGAITYLVAPPREIQLALKLLF
jgi:hypothetical protein